MRSWWLALDADQTPVRAFDTRPDTAGCLEVVEVIEDDGNSPARRWMLFCDRTGAAQHAVSYLDLPAGVRWSQLCAVNTIPVRAR